MSDEGASPPVDLTRLSRILGEDDEAELIRFVVLFVEGHVMCGRPIVLLCVFQHLDREFVRYRIHEVRRFNETDRIALSFVRGFVSKGQLEKRA